MSSSQVGTSSGKTQPRPMLPTSQTGSEVGTDQLDLYRAGGIAHDFNNVLPGIVAYGEMLFAETPSSSPLKRRLVHFLTE
jgi:hypothetical protein